MSKEVWGRFHAQLQALPGCGCPADDPGMLPMLCKKKKGKLRPVLWMSAAVLTRHDTATYGTSQAGKRASAKNDSHEKALGGESAKANVRSSEAIESLAPGTGQRGSAHLLGARPRPRDHATTPRHWNSTLDQRAMTHMQCTCGLCQTLFLRKAPMLSGGRTSPLVREA